MKKLFSQVVAGFCLVGLSVAAFAASSQSIKYHAVPGSAQVIACYKNGVEIACPSDTSDLGDMKGLYNPQNGSFQLAPKASADATVKPILLGTNAFQPMLSFKSGSQRWVYSGKGIYNSQDDSIVMSMNFNMLNTKTNDKGEVKVKNIIFTRS